MWVVPVVQRSYAMKGSWDQVKTASPGRHPLSHLFAAFVLVCVVSVRESVFRHGLQKCAVLQYQEGGRWNKFLTPWPKVHSGVGSRGISITLTTLYGRTRWAMVVTVCTTTLVVRGCLPLWRRGCRNWRKCSIPGWTYHVIIRRDLSLMK